MALPREPRQKMINMMYLVLTALLALNVSSEILNAFKTVNNSLEETNRVVNQSTTDVMTSLAGKNERCWNCRKSKNWYPKAQQVQNLTADINNYIQGLKDNILTEAGGDYSKTYKAIQLIKKIILILLQDSWLKKVKEKTFSKLDANIKKIFLKLDPAIATEFSKSLPIHLEKPKTQNKGNNTWEAAYFHNGAYSSCTYHFK